VGDLTRDSIYLSQQHLDPVKAFIIEGITSSVALPFTLKSILRQKKNYENSNISPCKNISSKKPSQRNQNPSRYHN
jgi:hypothetical protein